MVLVKTHDEIRAMAVKIKLAADTLPDYAADGQSNEDDKQIHYDWNRALNRAIAGSQISDVNHPEVYRWLYGTGWSALEDYDD